MRTDQQFGRTKNTPQSQQGGMLARWWRAGGRGCSSALTGPYLHTWSCFPQLYLHGPSSGSNTVATNGRNVVLHSGNFRYCHLRPQASDWSCDLCSVCQTSCHTCTPPKVPALSGSGLQGKMLVREGTCSAVVLELQSEPPVVRGLVLMTGADVSAGGRQQ